MFGFEKYTHTAYHTQWHKEYSLNENNTFWATFYIVFCMRPPFSKKRFKYRTEHII